MQAAQSVLRKAEPRESALNERSRSQDIFVGQAGGAAENEKRPRRE
jgi:hypothetical protein